MAVPPHMTASQKINSLGSCAHKEEPDSGRTCSTTLISNAPRKIPTWKRTFDLLIIFLGSPLIAILFIVVGSWIRLGSGAPIFYRQERVGLGGRRFMMIKFRSMEVGADQGRHDAHVKQLIESGKPLTKLDSVGDSRVIPGGEFLRSSGLDELPQIMNVIRGNMSLIGPRPCTLAEFESYTPEQKERFNAPPGITGYWQVNGKNTTTFLEMNAMDIHYTRAMSLLLDLRIMLKTLPAIIGQIRNWFRRRCERGTLPRTE